MLDYLIFHPDRGREQRVANCDVILPDGSNEGRLLNIWVDRVSEEGKKNEDPFIWTLPWLYSYCHATQLVRIPRATSPHVAKGSRLFFCDSGSAKKGVLKVDTVFVVADSHQWKVKGEKLPVAYAKCANRNDDALWLRHFSHGVRRPDQKGHKGAFTYVAEHDYGRSFLPMSEDGKRFEVSVREVWGDEVSLEGCLPERRSSYPKKLNQLQATQLYERCADAPLKVISAMMV